MEVQRIPLDLIDPSPFNVRQEIQVDGLAGSMLDAGQIVPLRVRPTGDRFEVRTGTRRFYALRDTGASHADAIVVEGSDGEVIAEQWVENEERMAYTDYERALKLRQILDATGLNQTELADRVGKDKSWVSRHLAILKLEDVLPRGNIHLLSEKQARAILAAPEEDRQQLARYVEAYHGEQGETPPASDIEACAGDLELAREMEQSWRPFADLKGADTPEPGTVEEYAEEAKGFIVEHGLEVILEGEPSSSPYLTKLGMLSDEELGFCLVHETRSISLRRLNTEKRLREFRGGGAPQQEKAQPGEGSEPAAEEPPVNLDTAINKVVGLSAPEIVKTLVEGHGVTEEQAREALESYRETFPDIWALTHPDPEETPEADEEPMTAERYVRDVLSHNPEVGHEELAKTTAEMFGVSESYARGLIDRALGRKRGRKPRDAMSPVTTCPLCGRANAEKNRLLMILEGVEANDPEMKVADWLREVLA